MANKRTIRRPIFHHLPRANFPPPSTADEWLYIVDDTDGGLWNCPDRVAWQQVAPGARQSLLGFQRQVVNSWHGADASGTITATGFPTVAQLGYVLFVPFFTPRRIKIDKATIAISVLGSSSPSYRVGLYADGGNPGVGGPGGVPWGAPLSDGGSVAIASAPSFPAWPFASPPELQPGWYHFGVEAQGVGSTPAQYYIAAGALPREMFADPGSGGLPAAGFLPVSGEYVAGSTNPATGLPTIAATPVVTFGYRPMVWFRISAIV